jgi:hypothetical protein
VAPRHLGQQRQHVVHGVVRHRQLLDVGVGVSGRRRRVVRQRAEHGGAQRVKERRLAVRLGDAQAVKQRAPRRVALLRVVEQRQ